MRTIIIGDIHGCFNALMQLLQLCKFNNTSDRLIFLGDYVDGWYDSVQLIDYLIKIQSESQNRHIFLKGNHEVLFSEVLEEDINNFRNLNYIKAKYALWIKNGGLTTYESYIGVSEKTRERHKLNFFSTLRDFYIEDQTLFVHAGFDYKIGFEKTFENNLNLLFNDRSLFELSYANWKSQEKSRIEHVTKFEKIFIGHTPTTIFDIKKPTLMGNVINLDQGCKLNGSLTGWILGTGEYFQSKEING